MRRRIPRNTRTVTLRAQMADRPRNTAASSRGRRFMACPLSSAALSVAQPAKEADQRPSALAKAVLASHRLARPFAGAGPVCPRPLPRPLAGLRRLLAGKSACKIVRPPSRRKARFAVARRKPYRLSLFAASPLTVAVREERQMRQIFRTALTVAASRAVENICRPSHRDGTGAKPSHSAGIARLGLIRAEAVGSGPLRYVARRLFYGLRRRLRRASVAGGSGRRTRPKFSCRRSPP